MRIAKSIQLLWAIFFLLIIGVRGIASGSMLGVMLSLISVVYLVSTIGCLFNHRIAWLVAICLPVILLVRWVPMICVNLLMFLRGHELYQDSPATIIVVAIYAVIFVVPAVLIYICLLLDRKRLMAALFPTDE